MRAGMTRDLFCKRSDSGTPFGVPGDERRGSPGVAWDATPGYLL